MSMSSNPYDIVLAEALFRTFKRGLVNGNGYKTREEAKQDAFNHIKSYRKKRRMHSTLGFISPAEFKETNWPEDEGRSRTA